MAAVNLKRTGDLECGMLNKNYACALCSSRIISAFIISAMACELPLSKLKFIKRR